MKLAGESQKRAFMLSGKCRCVTSQCWVFKTAGSNTTDGENLVQMYHKLVLGFYEHHGEVKHAVNLVQMYHQAGFGGFLNTTGEKEAKENPRNKEKLARPTVI